MCSCRKCFRVSEERSKCWNYFYHQYCHTYYHTDDEQYWIRHSTLDFSCNRVYFLCLICNLYKCLIEFSSSFSGFNNRYFRIDKTSIILGKCIVHSRSSLDFIYHKIIEFDHIWLFFLFFQSRKTLQYGKVRIYHGCHDAEKYHFLTKLDGSLFEYDSKKKFQYIILFLFLDSFFDIHDDDVWASVCFHIL